MCACLISMKIMRPIIFELRKWDAPPEQRRRERTRWGDANYHFDKWFSLRVTQWNRNHLLISFQKEEKTNNFEFSFETWSYPYLCVPVWVWVRFCSLTTYFYQNHFGHFMKMFFIQFISNSMVPLRCYHFVHVSGHFWIGKNKNDMLLYFIFFEKKKRRNEKLLEIETDSRREKKENVVISKPILSGIKNYLK